MAIFRCKACGAPLEIGESQSVVTCQYCGLEQTLPRLDDERRLNMFDRANHFRRQSEFDKAMGIYEQILQEDGTDAEAYWSMVLCRYGVQYVEDTDTGKRIPTINRTQFTSIFLDEDYKLALHYADAVQRQVYQADAQAIDGILKGILDISGKEKPFDVFICYKETDENGERTRDSALAQEIYYQLTQIGYHVFFSRITLEEKLGHQYEPYIFAALNSARVLLAIGTKPAYLNSAWVKNEWSRFLTLMKQDRGRLLIPCYRDMDPYDLPDELSMLQSQDMSKIGFMQDLIRGVRKVLEAGKPPVRAAQAAPASGAATGTAAVPGFQSLMERARLFMEDRDFENAEKYLERVLDIQPKYAPAYAAKVCVALGLSKEEELATLPFLYEDNADWQKALRFADTAQRAVYEGYIAQVKARVAAQIRQYAWDCAMEMAASPAANREALDKAMEAYREACCKGRTDGTRRKNAQQNEERFRQAVETHEPGDVSEESYKQAAEMFGAIGDEAAAASAAQCLALAELARKKKDELAAARSRRRKKRWTIVLLVLIALGVIWYVVQIYLPEKGYQQAAALLEAGEYDRAAEAFNALGEYNDAAERIKEANYRKAKSLYENGEIEAAGAIYATLIGYKDVDQIIREDSKLADIAGSLDVGKIVMFGSYGGEPVEWLVLEEKGDERILISVNLLDAKFYHETTEFYITWEICTLRRWLNKEFINSAFTPEEQEHLVLSDVSADENPWSLADAGRATRDKVWLLSITEMEKYKEILEECPCRPTQTASEKGIETSEDDRTRRMEWWLRSPGLHPDLAANAYGRSGISTYGGEANECAFGLRPVICLKVSSPLYSVLKHSNN